MTAQVLSNFFFYDNQFSFEDHKVYAFIGNETKDYLQRQLTVDLNEVVNRASLACRLDRTGRVYSFFYLINNADRYYLVVNNDLAQATIEELEKFIIMEDIEIKEVNKVATISTHKKDDFVPITIFDGQAYIGLTDKAVESTISKEILDKLITLSAWPTFNLNITQKDLVNETRLNEYALSYKKGCFLGQETAAKIESRRGAARFPVLVESRIKLEGDELSAEGKKLKILSSYEEQGMFFYSVKAPRDFLINDLDIDSNMKIKTYPIENLSADGLSEVFFNKAVSLYHKKEVEKAIELLDMVISFNPHYADAYESKGVILGNSGDHQKAIDVMDQLLKVDENSVMAHTNKSLYLMKLGKIEEAEEEKSLATVASFKRFGDEAKFKKEQEERERAEKEDRARRFDMFNKVLAIDENDVVANYGLADIHFSNDKFDKAMGHIEIVLNENPKYSVAYLLKSKILFKQKKYDDCLSVIEKGMPIATSQGELMPANEMQALKSKISKL
ncbi:CDC27 family protein [Halobacteriovorax sp. XZX-3]|uniref:CDC27 family protein n=1 Tax=unclassified Halobacteriovorax TaxID=2639665 RepID=UPI0037198D6C